MAQLKPRNVKPRDPTSNSQANGAIYNPPRYPQMAFPQRNQWKKNTMKVERPGGGKVI